jgi:hypothetical protein
MWNAPFDMMNKFDRLATKIRGCVELHVPLGFFNALLWLVGPEYLLLFGCGFGFYELIQDKYDHDKSYKDVLGWLIGFGIGGMLLLIIKRLGGII